MSNENHIEFKYTTKKEKGNNSKVKQNAFSILKKLKV